MDRERNKQSCIIYKNRRRTYEDMTGIVNKGNNHRFCTITMKRNIRYKQSVAKKKIKVLKY